ncbi:MAG: HIT family protein [Candidatus Nanohaloarchaea archaeon]|nr:HIT family protein [Candidatus Nanohaloarchaea archaeon]
MPQQPGGGDCIFCQLLDNPQQTLTVHETDNFRAWLDINPRAKGHTMVIPKDHVESAEDLGKKLLEMFNVARIVGEKAKNGLGADGYSIVVNNGKEAGQRLEHFYMIVFPRFADEENAGTPTGAIFPPMEDLDKQKLQEFQKEMKEAGFGEFSESITTEYEQVREKKKERQESAEKGEKSFRRKDSAEFR